MALLLLLSVSTVGNAEVITKSSLEGMFSNIEKKTQWNMKKPMLWGYFFTGKTQTQLKQVSQALTKNGYKFVEIFPNEEGNGFWLHVEKVEIHSVESLHKRNSKLYEFSSKFTGVEYDGMDVGPAKP